MFVLVGRHITQSNDLLVKMSVDEIIRRIRQPKEEFKNLIHQLRIANTIDPNKYRELKKQLPYFTCGVFHPPIRRKENFAVINLFVIDIDHLTANEIDVDKVYSGLKEDYNVIAFFTSPGGDGIKVLFRLDENCSDANLFSAFYKVFAVKFAQKHAIEKAVDYKTSDVSRACFISFDPNAYFTNESAQVSINDYIYAGDYELSEPIIKEAQEFSKEHQVPQAGRTKELDNDILNAIKQKLNPQFRIKQPKSFYVPSEVEAFLPIVKEQLKLVEIELIQATAIHYGKKLRVTAGRYWAELNIFYGKKGYSIVKTPKNGSNDQLADLAYQVIYNLIHE